MQDMFLHDKMNILNGQMTKTYYIIFNLIAIAIIIYIGIDTFYRVVRMQFIRVDFKTTNSQVVQEETPFIQASSNNYQTIIDRNIFNAVTAASAKNNDNDEIKFASLRLALIGTIAGDDKTSIAFIEDMGTKTQDIYKIGANIQGAVVKSILKGKVVLKVGNRDEVLTMDGGGPDDETKTSSRTSQANMSTEEGSPSTAALNERNITIPRSEIESSLKDINSLISQASIQDHSSDGQPDGLTVTGIKAGSIFRKMGLRNGDVVKAVNNDAIKTTDDLISLYNNLKSAPDLSLQIVRRGQTRNFNYSLTD
jgi:general secretion pathway protein C